MGAIFNIMKRIIILSLISIMMLLCISCGKKDTAFEETSKAVLTVEETTKETQTEAKIEVTTEIQSETTTEEETTVSKSQKLLKQ